MMLSDQIEIILCMGSAVSPLLIRGSRLEWGGMHRAKQIKLLSNVGKLVYQIGNPINLQY